MPWASQSGNRCSQDHGTWAVEARAWIGWSLSRPPSAIWTPDHCCVTPMTIRSRAVRVRAPPAPCRTKPDRGEAKLAVCPGLARAAGRPDPVGSGAPAWIGRPSRTEPRRPARNLHARVRSARGARVRSARRPRFCPAREPRVRRVARPPVRLRAGHRRASRRRPPSAHEAARRRKPKAWTLGFRLDAPPGCRSATGDSGPTQRPSACRPAPPPEAQTDPRLTRSPPRLVGLPDSAGSYNAPSVATRMDFCAKQADESRTEQGGSRSRRSAEGSRPADRTSGQAA